MVLDECRRKGFEQFAELQLVVENCKSCPVPNAVQLQEVAERSAEGFVNSSSSGRAQIHLPDRLLATSPGWPQRSQVFSSLLRADSSSQGAKVALPPASQNSLSHLTLQRHTLQLKSTRVPGASPSHPPLRSCTASKERHEEKPRT